MQGIQRVARSGRSMVQDMARRGRYRVRPGTIAVGVGRGLRFDPGPSNPDYETGSNELPVQLALERAATTGGVVADIGANVGFFTVIAARLVGSSGRVFAFEPVPANARQVRRNAALNHMANVVVVEAAVSDTAGRSELLLAEYSGGAALPVAGPPPDAAGTIEVETVTLDGFVASGRMPIPTVVKIDVEGAELPVLRGMAELCREHRPTVICEVDDGSADGLRRKREEVTAWLKQAGYAVDELEDSYPGGGWLVRHLVATAAR